ncbi:MAG: hypothetical protein U1E14_00485 [Geminicoccaceae bacterium]
MSAGLAIGAGRLRAVAVPEIGGSLARFDLVEPDGSLVPLFRPWDGSPPTRSPSPASR